MTKLIDTSSRLPAVKSAVKLLCIGLIAMVAKFAFPNEFRESQGAVLTIVVVVLVLIINVFLFYKLLLGANWVRVLLLLGFVIGVVPSSLLVILEFSSNLPLAFFTLIGLIAEFFAFYLLFTKPASEWFKK